jgi:hypothetical protein
MQARSYEEDTEHFNAVDCMVSHVLQDEPLYWKTRWGRCVAPHKSGSSIECSICCKIPPRVVVTRLAGAVYNGNTLLLELRKLIAVKRPDWQPPNSFYLT